MRVTRRPPRRASEQIAERLEMERLARAVRTAYILERSEYETLRAGQWTSWSPKREADLFNERGKKVCSGLNSVWEKVAQICRELQAHPASYVRVQFEAWNDPRRAPPPAFLVSRRAQDIYLEAMPRKLAELNRALQAQKEVAIQQIRCLRRAGVESADEAAAIVIGDLTLPLSPLFRYCFAASLGSKQGESLCRRLRASAVAQYLRFADLYDQTWSQVLPASFRKEAERLWDEWI